MQRQNSVGEIRLHFFAWEAKKSKWPTTCALSAQQPTGLLRQDFESLLLLFRQKQNHPIGWFCFWRSRRDSNSRAAFGDYTISSRARYDHFDTTPYSLWLRDSMDYYTKKNTVVKKKIAKSGIIFSAAAQGAVAAPAPRPCDTPTFSYIMSLTDSTA